MLLQGDGNEDSRGCVCVWQDNEKERMERYLHVMEGRDKGSSKKIRLQNMLRKVMDRTKQHYKKCNKSQEDDKRGKKQIRTLEES